MTSGVEVTITGIFPVPIYQTILSREISTEEKNFFNKLERTKNEYNYNSKNNYVLDEEPLSTLKKELFLRVEDYFQKIITPKTNVLPYITQSWVNWTKSGEQHHKHAHTNSLFSGVFYIDADEEYDSIKFFKRHTYESLSIEPYEYHLFNSESWTFKVKTGDIILFPSSLGHLVESKIGDNLRTSLSFNTFIKGTIGVDVELTELKI
tara:strand:+ start:2216 stop:2836 length:621 start_codon:yes stop_codon:yes gene_type:complete